MKRFCIFALVAMMFAACTTDETQDVQFADAPETLTVGFEGGDDDTRVQLNEAGKTVWTKGDLVSVFYRSDANQQWQFQGETGDTNGKLKRISQGNTPNIGLDKVVAVYPYNANYLIELQTGNIQALLPSAQEYAEDSYGIGSSIMISSSRTDKLYLKNVCGWLKLQLTGDTTIGYISLKGNNGEQIAGNVFITADDASCTLASDLNDLYGDGSGDLEGTLIDPNTIFSLVGLDCGNGVTLGTEATAFYIALPPQTFEKGVTVKIFDTSGKVMTKSTDNSLTIERNTIQPMAVFEANAELFGTPTLPTPANNEIYYTNGSITQATKPYKTDVFGANIVSNLYDAEKECWVIKFDGDVTTIGDYAFYNRTSLTSVTIPDSVTSIGSDAFYGCTSLTSITIPDSVTSIGDYAFNKCASLTSVDITDLSAWCKISFLGSSANPLYNGAKLYINNTEATNINIPSDITEIKSYAFYKCTSLTSVNIPDSVTSIGDYAFCGCTSLTSVTIPDSVTWIGDAAFGYCTSLTSVTIPDSVTSIGSSAFYNCTSLTSVTIGKRVKWIGLEVFRNCTSLKAFYGKFASEDNRCFIVNSTLYYFAPAGITSYTIPDSITSIGFLAFYYCTSLTSVTIPDSVTSIESGAFYYCTSLTSITIPDSVTEIGEEAFGYCESLTSVNIPDSVTKIGEEAFRDCTSLTSVTIPNSVTKIGDYAFIDCTSLTSVNIGNGVTEIGEHAFRDCDSLTSVTIPNSVTEIGYGAFSDCTSLTSVNIGNGVTKIGSFAFYECNSLKEVYCKPTTPPAVSSNTFSNNASDRKIYVPASDDDSIINAYKMADGWSDYASYIKEYDFSAEQ